VGAQSGGLKHEPIITPRDLVQRTFHLKEAFNGLKTDLLEEFNMMDARIIKPATEAKEYLQPLKRVIKKREGKRLDVERYQERVKHAQKKQNRTEREDAALARAEEDLSKASDVKLKISHAFLYQLLTYFRPSMFQIHTFKKHCLQLSLLHSPYCHIYCQRKY
jgi:amphiphysin